MTTQGLINQYVTAHADNRWMDASELEALLTEFAEKLKEPASEDLEQASIEHANKVHNDTAPGERIAACRYDFKAGAQWQKEQMIKDTIECNYRKARLASGHYLSDLTMADMSELTEVADRLQLRDRDKVKIIIIKE